MESAGSTLKPDIHMHQTKRRHVPQNCKLDDEAGILAPFTALSSRKYIGSEMSDR